VHHPDTIAKLITFLVQGGKVAAPEEGILTATALPSAAPLAGTGDAGDTEASPPVASDSTLRKHLGGALVVSTCPGRGIRDTLHVLTGGITVKVKVL